MPTPPRRLPDVASDAAAAARPLDWVGMSNLATFLQNTESYRRDLRRAEYGDERDPAMRAWMDSTAALTNVASIAKPLFVIQGANDPRVPRSEAEQIVRAVRGNRGPVWYLLRKSAPSNTQIRSLRLKKARDSLAHMIPLTPNDAFATAVTGE